MAVTWEKLIGLTPCLSVCQCVTIRLVNGYLAPGETSGWLVNFSTVQGPFTQNQPSSGVFSYIHHQLTRTAKDILESNHQYVASD